MVNSRLCKMVTLKLFQQAQDSRSLAKQTATLKWNHRKPLSCLRLICRSQWVFAIKNLSNQLYENTFHEIFHSIRPLEEHHLDYEELVLASAPMNQLLEGHFFSF